MNKLKPNRTNSNIDEEKLKYYQRLKYYNNRNNYSNYPINYNETININNGKYKNFFNIENIEDL